MTTLITPGVCAVCGCSEPFACDGGCGWADATRTLCTRCAIPAPAATPSYRILLGIEHDAILCTRCGSVSHHPGDVWQRYCGRCKHFHEETSQ